MKNISDLDYQIMGFDVAKARPENMIIINFPIKKFSAFISLFGISHTPATANLTSVKVF